MPVLDHVVIGLMGCVCCLCFCRGLAHFVGKGSIILYFRGSVAFGSFFQAIGYLAWFGIGYLLAPGSGTGSGSAYSDLENGKWEMVVDSNIDIDSL